MYVNNQYFNINFQNFNTCRNYYTNKTKCLKIIVCNLINLLYKLTEENRFSNKNKRKGNGAGLAWENPPHSFADEFGITHAYSFGIDPQHDYSQGNLI